LARPVFFEVPILNIPVYFYGFFVTIAYIVGYFLFEQELRRKQLKADPAVFCGLGLVGSFSCSKLTYLLFLDGVNADPSQGHSFQGGVVGAAVFTSLYCIWCRLSILDIFDLIAPILCLGHGIGKLGCFFAGDGCYGPPTKVPWAMSFPNGLIPTKKYVHPTPLYEFVCSCAVFAFLWMKRKDRRWPGDQLWDMMVVFGLERLLIEAFRGHEPEFLGKNLTIYQLWALGGVSLGLILQAIAHIYFDGRILHRCYTEDKKELELITKRITELEELSTKSSFNSRSRSPVSVSIRSLRTLAEESRDVEDEWGRGQQESSTTVEASGSRGPPHGDGARSTTFKSSSTGPSRKLGAQGRESRDTGQAASSSAESDIRPIEQKPKQGKKKSGAKKGGSKQKETMTTKMTTHDGAPPDTPAELSTATESKMPGHNEGIWETQRGSKRKARSIASAS